LLDAAVVGLMAGCRKLSDVEALTEEMSNGMQRMLHPTLVPR